MQVFIHPEQFRGPYLKAARAASLLDQFQIREAAYWKNCRPFVVECNEPGSGRRFAVVKVSERPPEILHILAAEVIYHLRSGLDQIIVACGRLCSLNKSQLTELYFPTAGSIRQFRVAAVGDTETVLRIKKDRDGKAKRIRGKVSFLDRDLIKLVLDQKAYNGGNEPLRNIFKLANIDKHVELIPISSRGKISNLSTVDVQGAIVGVIVGDRRSLNEGVRISELGPDGVFELRDPEKNIGVSGEMCFGNTGKGINEQRPIVGILSECLVAYQKTLEAFASHCDRSGRIGVPEGSIQFSI